MRWDKHYSHNNVYFWKRECQICWTIYLSIASLLRHRGKYICMKRYHCPHQGPDYPFAVFKWDSISSWHFWRNLTVTMTHVYCTCSAPSELYAKSFISGRIYIYLEGEDCDNMFLKKVHMVPCSIIKISRKIGRDISVQKNCANERLFSLNVWW